MTAKIIDAISVASAAHQGQVRKYTGEAYINHPLSVASMVQNYIDNEHMQVVALLHDAIEDCEVSFADLVLAFGIRVARDVMLLSDLTPHSEGNRAYRKAKYRKVLRKSPEYIQLIKVCDMMDNYASIKEHDQKFAKVFESESRLMLSEGVTPKEEVSDCPELYECVADFLEMLEA